MDQEKKSLSFILILLVSVMFMLIVGQWIVVNNILQSVPLEYFYIKIQPPILVRLLYVLLIVFMLYLTPAKKIKWVEENLNLCIVVMFLFGVLLVLGFTSVSIYNLLIFPLVFLLYTYFAIVVISSLSKGKLRDDKSIFGVSCVDSDFYFDFETEQGTLRIHKPQQNIWIDGGPGSGKSASWIKGMIAQCAERNYAGFIYDWEGDPLSDGSPILGKVAYGSIQEYTERNKCHLQFGFINFSDMMRTSRVNVFSSKYVPLQSSELFIKNISITLLKNLEPAWKEKTDFWANGAITFVSSVAYKCFKERDKGINTLAHVIAFCLHNYEEVFAWLSEDEEISLSMSSLLSGWQLGASQQTAGVVSSAQTPLSKLNNKYIFWVLSPSEDEELNLDITNKNHPTLLCIGNSPKIKEAVSPAISCIASVIMSQMNNPGKCKSVFMVDEFPTINLQGIDTFIGTARKHYVSTILALQDFNQAVRDYGDKSANILKASCGSQAFGMTGNDKTSQDVEKLFGEVKQVQESYSQQDSGGGSRSESLQKEKIFKARDLAGQSAGHFVGKIANGKPAYFNLQMKECKYFEKEIPLFSKKVNTGDDKLDSEIMDSIVEKNYFSILRKVKEVLEDYKPKPNN